MIIKFKGYDCVLDTTRKYPNGNVAIILLRHKTGEMICKATISVPHLILDETEVVIKNYSENEGILEVLENAGVIKQTGQFATVGYVQAPICKLLKRV